MLTMILKDEKLKVEELAPAYNHIMKNVFPKLDSIDLRGNNEMKRYLTAASAVSFSRAHHKTVRFPYDPNLELDGIDMTLTEAKSLSEEEMVVEYGQDTYPDRYMMHADKLILKSIHPEPKEMPYNDE